MREARLVAILSLSGYLLNGCGSGRSTPRPPVITHFEVAATFGVISGTPFNVTVAALAVGDIVITTYSGTVHFTSSDPQAVLPADSTITSGAGTFSVTLRTMGSQTITASVAGNPSISGTSNTISVTGPATHLSVAAPSTAVAGTAFNVTVTPIDASNNTVSGYSGTVRFTSTDSQAVLPANTAQNGVGKYSATLKTLSGQTITATDTNSASIIGTSNSINVLAFAITSGPPPNGTVGQPYGGQHSVTIEQCTLTFVGHELDAAGGAGGYHWSWSAAPGSTLPPGLAITVVSTTCGGSTRLLRLAREIISGTPTAAGTYNVIVTVTDSASPPAQASATYTINIANPASASDAREGSPSAQHHHYKFVELGMLGGPNSYLTFSNRSLSNSGVAAGTTDTSTPVNAPLCFIDCFLIHTFLWKDGTQTDLGGLPGVAISGSLPNYINEKGVVAGIAFNGGVDDVVGVPRFDGVVWKDGQIIDLGTFGGPLSYAAAINDRDEAVGFALNATPDPFDLGSSCQNFPMPTQMRAFIWRNGVKKDLGTLGGTDSCALFINERGEAAGHSFTDSIVNPSTGFPTIHPFLWDGEKMIDLHTLGGTLAFASGLNNSGQVAGTSGLAEDQELHAFLWDKGKLVDFGSLGGFLVEVIGFSEAGEMVGKADLPGSAMHHAFLAKDAKMIDLGSQDGDPCSFAVAINSKQQIVGASTDCSNALHAFLWENGQMIDLNAFVPASSTLTLAQATFINDGGEITAEGVLPNGDQHAVLLIPCDENHPDIEGCDYSLVEESASATTQTTLAAPAPATTAQQKLTPSEMQDRIRAMMTRNHRFGLRPQQ